MEFEEAVKSVAAKVATSKTQSRRKKQPKPRSSCRSSVKYSDMTYLIPRELVPEFTADVGVKKGEKVDYALVLDEQVQILMNARK